jgi:hypothetical protein
MRRRRRRYRPGRRPPGRGPAAGPRPAYGSRGIPARPAQLPAALAATSARSVRRRCRCRLAASAAASVCRSSTMRASRSTSSRSEDSSAGVGSASYARSSAPDTPCWPPETWCRGSAGAQNVPFRMAPTAGSAHGETAPDQAVILPVRNLRVTQGFTAGAGSALREAAHALATPDARSALDRV